MGVSAEQLCDLIQRHKRVRCIDCAHKDQIRIKNGMGDGVCPVSYATIVGYGNNQHSITQPRICYYFKPEEAHTT